MTKGKNIDLILCEIDEDQKILKNEYFCDYNEKDNIRNSDIKI